MGAAVKRDDDAARIARVDFDAGLRHEAGEAVEVDEGVRGSHAVIMAENEAREKSKTTEYQGSDRRKGGRITHHGTRRAFHISRLDDSQRHKQNHFQCVLSTMLI